MLRSNELLWARRHGAAATDAPDPLPLLPLLLLLPLGCGFGQG